MTTVLKNVTMNTTERTILYLLKHPKPELHVRGLGRELGIAPQIISRNLKLLEEQKLVAVKQLGAQKFTHFISDFRLGFHRPQGFSFLDGFPLRDDDGVVGVKVVFAVNTIQVSFHSKFMITFTILN